MAIEIIANINQVEGFNPEEYVRTISDNNGENPKKYLDVMWRKVWFYKKYPDGRIITKIVNITNTYVIVEAKVYFNRNDPEENYVASAMAQRWFKPGDTIGERAVETAETGAIGRALANAGFGLQYCCDLELDKEIDIVDAPVTPKQTNTTVKTTPVNSNESKKTKENKNEIKNTGTGVVPKNETSNNQVILDAPIGLLLDTNTKKENSAINNSDKTDIPDEIESNDTNINNQENTITEIPETPNTETNPIKYDNSMEAGEIIKIMKFEDAFEIVVDCGFNKGKRLGDIANSKADDLKWYFTSYTGKNNILKAGAKILFNYVEEMKQNAG